MRPKLPRGLGEVIGSVICFVAVLGTLVVIDDRVRDRIMSATSSGQLASWSDRASAMLDVVLTAARDQSIAHAPLLVFSVVAVVLVLFMLRT